MATKLHQLFAVKNNLAGQVEKTLQELGSVTFQTKKHLFEREVLEYKPLVEDPANKEKTEVRKDIQTTVHRELKWIYPILTDYFDVCHQINVGNMSAKADIELEDGTILLRDVPATTLLELEKFLDKVKRLVSSIPTLDGAKGFTPDFGMSNEGDIYKARPRTTITTKKVFVPLVLSPATDKHPAQVKESFEDKPWGEVTTHEWSALIPTSEKADMLNRVDVVIRAVKKARSKANEQEVNPNNRITSSILNFVLGR